MDRDETRAAFEKWFFGYATVVREGDGYKRQSANHGWASWQAATAAAEVKYLPVIRELVEALEKIVCMRTKSVSGGYEIEDVADVALKALAPFTPPTPTK